MTTPAYLTQTDGVSRPKIELGEVNDGVLNLAFQIHNLTSRTLRYRVSERVLTDSFRKLGDRYENKMTARLLKSTDYTVTDLAGQSYALTVLVKNKYSTIQSENNPKYSNRRAALQVEVVTVDGEQMIFSDGSETKWTFEPVDPENGVYYVSTMVDGSFPPTT